MNRLIIAAAALGSIAALTTAPACASTEQVRTARASYADLDLSQPGNMKVLRHRIAKAIDTICGWPSGDMDEMMANARCRHAATRSADRQIAAIKSARSLAAAEIPATAVMLE